MEINEGKLKEILDEQRKEYQHFVGIFKEDLQSQIGLIAEQYQDIKDDLSIIKTELRQKVSYEEFNNLSKRVSLLEMKIKK